MYRRFLTGDAISRNIILQYALSSRPLNGRDVINGPIKIIETQTRRGEYSWGRDFVVLALYG